MTKPGDLPPTKKTIHELAKEFPSKTYRELEKYRDADRVEEAIGIGHNHPPEETFKKACTLGEMKKDRNYPDLTEVLATENDKLKKRAQEAEGELSIIKGINNMSPEMKDANKKIGALEREVKERRRNTKSFILRIEKLKKEVKSLKWIKDHDYIFLIDENKKLHAENKKLKEGAVDRARKAGL